MKKQNTKKGFTLVELLVVIAILAILATVSIVGYSAFIKKAHESNALAELHQVQTIIESELLDDNEWKFVGADSVEYTVSLADGALVLTDANGTADLTIDAVLPQYVDFANLKGTFTLNGLELSYAAYDVTVTTTLNVA